MKTIIIASCFLFLTPALALAQTTPAKPTGYQQLAPLPGYVATENGKTTASQYLQGIFTLTIALAGALAVVMIIIGGIKYMSTDAFTEKSTAKTTITNAIWGLFLAIGAWLILYTVNPNLTKFDLRSLEPQPIPQIGTNTGLDGRAPTADCPNCVVLRVNHKYPPYGCKAPGPCTVDAELANRLMRLQTTMGFLVTESYPPTMPVCSTPGQDGCHKATCHGDGTCVDATITSNTPQNVSRFIELASQAGLRAEYEVLSESRKSAIISATGLSASQVIVVPHATGEHFSLYKK